MVSITTSTDRRAGVTLVTARLEGGDAPARVRLEHRLDGPLWPPRRQGVPAVGWHADGFEGVVPADGTLALGYASPAPPRDPPVELAAVEHDPDPDDPFDSAASVLRALGDPSPPVAVEADSVEEGEEGTPPVPTAGQQADGAGPATPAPAIDASPEPRPEPRGDQPVDIPDSVDTWFGEVTARIAAAECLTPTTSLSEAATHLRTVDGARVTDVEDRLEADAEALEVVADRATDLAERASATSVPTETLERLQ